MNMLPSHPKLPVHLLAACFNHTVASYKFYWFLSLLGAVETGERRVEKRRLFSGMVALGWYTYHYFHLSFGRQDKLGDAIELIMKQEGLYVDEKRSVILERLIEGGSKETKRILMHFDKEVPHRFLSPWFPGTAADWKGVYLASQSFERDVPYALFDDELVINPIWFDYLFENIGILRGFCYWHLSLYLQKLNPNVPDIAGKLIKPPLRGALNRQRKLFWDVVIDEVGELECIYTGRTLGIGNYAVEHFLPYAFVCHDQIWNLIPADKRFNMTKSDRLPVLYRYFDAFFKMQHLAINTISRLQPGNKFLQEYLTVIPDYRIDQGLDVSLLKQRFHDATFPMVTIAANNGFEFMV